MSEELYNLMDWQKIEALVYSEENEPQKTLKPKMMKNGILFQCFFPEARKVKLLFGKKKREYKMEMQDEAGFFACLIPEKQMSNYTYQVFFENGEEKHDTLTFSQNFSCPDCGISVDEVEPRSFSFNNPFGACPDCFGLGYKMEFDEDLMIPDKSLSINQGAITAMGWQSCTDKTSFSGAILNALAKEYDFSLDTPFEDYPKEIHDILIYGTGGKVVKVYYRGQRGEGIYDIAFEGLIQSMNRKYRETFSDSMKAEYETFMRITPCPTCKGQRLKKESLAVTVGGKNIFEATDMSIVKFREFIDALELTPMQQAIGAPILKEIRARISFLINVFKHISILYENSFSTGSREHALTYLKVVRPRTPLFLRLSYLCAHFTKA